jgi:GNAT superfamily N-acetyltransferase
MVKVIVTILLLVSLTTSAQVIGKTSTEDYQAGFEGKESIYTLPEYNGKPVPVALLDIGVSKEVIEQYPELGDYRVGLGLTNIVVAYLEETFRFEFVETKNDIKQRMIAQYKASQKGISTEKIELKGNIVLAKYFCYIEVYDFSISEDETINLKGGVKNKLVTRLGLQVKMVDAQSGTYMTGSGLGKSVTTREVTLLNNENLEEVKFNQSSIGTSTKKALESATAKVVKRMIQKQIFQN